MIAIADDHGPFRNGLAEMLSKNGFAIATLEKDGRDLLETLGSLSLLPHLCIVDVNMPTNGFVTTKTIKRKWPEMKVIACSLHDDKLTKRRMEMAGADAYHTKGSDPALLLKTIHELFRSHVVICEWSSDGFYCTPLTRQNIPVKN